jgi:hypothetical protein
MVTDRNFASNDARKVPDAGQIQDYRRPEEPRRFARDL